MLGDLGQGGSGDAFEGELRLLDAEDKKSNSTSINDRLSKLSVMLSNAGESEGSSLLDRWVKLLKTINESIESTRVNYSLGEVRGVLGNRSKDVSSSFFVESLKGKITRKVLKYSNLG